MGYNAGMDNFGFYDCGSVVCIFNGLSLLIIFLVISLLLWASRD
jgi:hypothetical protein